MTYGVAPETMNFLAMLARNARGWGPVGPASPEEGVPDPNELERGQNALRMFGPVAEAAAPNLLELAADPKGTVKAQGKEFAAQIPYVMAGPVLGAAGRIMAAAPRLSALAGGALGLIGLSSGAGKGSEGALQELLKQRASLDRQRAIAVEERDGQLKGRDGRKAGRGPIYDEKNHEVQRLTDEMSALDSMIGEENKRSSPEFQMEMQKKAASIEADQKAKEAATPFREKHPVAAEVLAAGGSIAATTLPFLLRGKANIGTFFPGSYVGRVNRTVNEANAAIDSRNIERAKRLGLELKQLVAQQPKVAKETSATRSAMEMAARAGRRAAKPLTAAGAGGALAAEGSLLPDQFDMGMLPEGPARERAREVALDPMNYVDRGITGTLTGFAGHEAGGLVPARKANITGAKAVIDYLTKAGRKTKATKDVGVKRATRKPRGQAND